MRLYCRPIVPTKTLYFQEWQNMLTYTSGGAYFSRGAYYREKYSRSEPGILDVDGLYLGILKHDF